MTQWFATNQSDLPFTAQQIRKHCRIVDDSDDELITLYAAAAAKQIATDTRLAVAMTDLTATLPAGTRTVTLPRAPFDSVVALEAFTDDAWVPLDVAGVGHDGGTPGVVTLGDGVPRDAAVRLTYRAGADPIDPVIQLAIYQLVAHWYEHREAASADGAPREIPISYRTFIRSLDPMNDAVT